MAQGKAKPVWISPLTPIREYIARLEAKIRELEARPGPPVAILRSRLATLHGEGHPKSGKRVVTYRGIIRSPTDPTLDGVPVFEFSPRRTLSRGRWHEENPERAVADAKREHENQPKRKR